MSDEFKWVDHPFVTDREQLLQQYIEAGFALVPLPKASKGPVTKGWNAVENTIRNKDELSRIQYGLGLAHAYSNPVTCSFDIDDLGEATIWLKDRGVNLQDLLDAPDAVQIISGKTNKAKLLYKLPSGVDPIAAKNIRGQVGVVLEFRCASKNGLTVQDVLPPSIHPDTCEPYQWGGAGTFDHLPEMPSLLLDLWIDKVVEPTPLKPAMLPACFSAEAEAVLKNIIGRADFSETPENIERVQIALDHIPAGLPYPDWLKILFAIKSLEWQCGEELAHTWSKSAPPKRYDESQFYTTWNSAKSGGGVGIGTLFHYERGYQASETQQKLVSLSHETRSLDREELLKAEIRWPLEQGYITLESTPPSPRDYAYAETVPMGTPAILAGLGGTAKTTLVMQLAVHGALSKYLGTMQVCNFSSMLFLGEENTEERDRRFGAICKELSPNERKKVSERVVCYPAAGEDVRLNSYVYQNIEETYLANRIISLAKEHEARCGLRVGLIVFDHARLVMSGDPNDANHVTQLTRILTKIARETGSSVLVLAHSPKSVYGKEQTSDASEVFGSSAFVDNMRSAFVLHTMRVQEARQFGIVEKDRSDYVCLSSVKSNYGRTGSYWWFKKEYHPDWQVVTLVPQQLYDQALFGQHDALSKKILNKIKCEPGRYSPRAFRTLSGKDGEFKASEKNVQRSIDRLLDEGALLKRPPTDDERGKYSLSKNTREVFDCP